MTLMMKAVPTAAIATLFNLLPNLYLGSFGRGDVPANVACAKLNNTANNNTFFMIDCF